MIILQDVNAANNMLFRLRGWGARHPLSCVGIASLVAALCLGIPCEGFAADTIRLLVTAALVGALAFAVGWLRPVCDVASAASVSVPLVSFLVVAAALVAAVFSALTLAAAPQVFPLLGFRGVSLFLSSCLATALFEEVLFRGVMVNGFFGAFRALAPASSQSGLSSVSDSRFPACDRDFARAGVLAAVVFGVLHVSAAVDFSSLNLIGLAQFFVKPVQAMIFGCLMTCVFAKTHGLLVPIALHFLYDAIAHSPAFLATGALPASYVTGSFFDLVGMIVGALLLVLPSLLLLCPHTER